MIFLILLYLCCFSGPSNTLALPTDFRPSEIFPRKQSIFIRNEDRFNTRAIYNILWSCLSTIFACTYITIHPNIPAPGDSQWAVLRRRVAIMGYFLLTPEFIIMWAARQHYGARYLTKKHIKKHTGWTRTHAFFLIMGGFTLHEGGKPVRILEARELEELWEAGKITWPTVTKEEIADRSKGDYLSKTIVLFQTTWFVGQCIARGAYGLTVTELEVVTVAFASLTGIVYYLWWDKPLDVRCSIPVHLLDGRLGEIVGDIEREEAGPQIILSPKIAVEEITERDENSNVVVKANPLPTTPNQLDTSISDSPPNRIRRFRAFRRGACEKYGTLFGLAYVFIGFPLKRFLSAFYDMSECKTLGDKSLRVPTFYSSYNDDDHNEDKPTRPTVCVATIFGAIHCIAWSFHFATLQEQWVWRISAIVVSTLPISFILCAFIIKVLYAEESNAIWKKFCLKFFALLLVVLIAPLYLIARTALFVLPFIALRALPLGAYVQLDWVSFLPHI
jgi:hypothetical protein